MRHGKRINHLGRKSAHRQAMLSNMAASLILHKRIKTTLQKAKALRMYVEPLINRSKENTTHSRRIVFSYLQNKEAVTELFRNVSDKVANRPGGYTRILKIENRLGDNAEMCYIELVDYNENMLKTDEKKTTRRSRRGSGKSAPTQQTTATTTTTMPEIEEKPIFTSTETPTEETVETPVEEVVETPAIEVSEIETPETVIAETPVEEVVENTETVVPEVVENPMAEVVEIPAEEVIENQEVVGDISNTETTEEKTEDNKPVSEEA